MASDAFPRLARDFDLTKIWNRATVGKVENLSEAKKRGRFSDFPRITAKPCCTRIGRVITYPMGMQ